MAYARAFGFVMLVPRRPVHQAARRLSYTSSNISNHVVTYIKLQKRALSMVPWLSRAEREAREKTRKTTELRVWANRCVPRRRSVVPCGGVGRGRGWTRLRGGWAIEKSRRSYHAVAMMLPRAAR